MNREHGADGDGKTSVSSTGLGTPGRPGVPPACARSAHKKTPPQAHVRSLLFPYLVIPATYSVIPAKAGISVKHSNTAPCDRDSRLRGNDEKVTTRPVSIWASMKEDANETPVRPRRVAP